MSIDVGSSQKDQADDSIVEDVEVEGEDGEDDENIIYPPPEIKIICDKTAGFVARNGPGFEDRIREKEQHNHKFCFLNPNDPYFKYFQWKVKADRVTASTTANAKNAKVVIKPVVQPRMLPMQPPPFDYMLDLPSISKQDYEIMKLTAQFVAINGQSFMTSISQRELRNPQFDFIRPSHSLYQCFISLIDQYRKIINPPRQIYNFLEINVTDRYKVLNRITKRMEFEAYVQVEKERVKQKRNDEQIAFATIDWHDFVVVEMIEFHAEDDRAILPLPMTIAELDAMTLLDKQSMLAFEDQDFQAHSTDMMQLEPTVQDTAPILGTNSALNLTNNPSAIIVENYQTPSLVRTNYTPKFGRHTQELRQTCPRCKASIKVSEMAEHMRIELLDPKYITAPSIQKPASNLVVAGQSIASNLKRMAEMVGSTATPSHLAFEADKARGLRDQKVIWDGNLKGAGLQEILQNPGLSRNNGIAVGPLISQPGLPITPQGYSTTPSLIESYPKRLQAGSVAGPGLKSSTVPLSIAAFVPAVRSLPFLPPPPSMPPPPFMPLPPNLPPPPSMPPPPSASMAIPSSMPPLPSMPVLPNMAILPNMPPPSSMPFPPNMPLSQSMLPPPPPDDTQPPPPNTVDQVRSNPAFPDQKRLKLNTNALTLTIESTTGSITFDDLTPLWTVVQLKERLVDWCGLASGKQKLSWCGRVLKNSDTILGVGPVLNLAEKSRGGRK